MTNSKLVPILVLVVLIAGSGWFVSQNQKPTESMSGNTVTTPAPSDKPAVVSTNPPLSSEDVNTILPTQALEITFNMPLENSGELKLKIEPTAELKIDLSADRRTAKISAKPNFKLGTVYSLYIMPDSKFNESPGQESTKKVLDHDILYKFKTPEFRGL